MWAEAHKTPTLTFYPYPWILTINFRSPFQRFNVGALYPVQQPRLCWDRSSTLPLVEKSLSLNIIMLVAHVLQHYLKHCGNDIEHFIASILYFSVLTYYIL